MRIHFETLVNWHGKNELIPVFLENNGQLSLVSRRKRVIRFACWVFLSAMEHIFNEFATQARTLASKRQAKTIKASHGPRVSPQSGGRRKGAENNGKSKGKSKRIEGAIQVSKGSGNGKTLIENLKLETCLEDQESAQMRQVGVKTAEGCVAQLQAHFHLKAQEGSM